MFHVEQRAVEYLFHVERGARCGEILPGDEGDK